MNTTAYPIPVLPLRVIHASAANPRRSYNPTDDDELLASIAAYGIRVPLVVRPINDWHGDDLYEIVDGQRRWAAAKELGIETVPVLILDLTDDQARTFRASLDTQQGRTA